jgi:hypothetical protein
VPEDHSEPSSSSASLRAVSPPPVLGSSALNEDLDDLDLNEASPSASITESAYASSTWGGGIWGMPSSKGWGAPAAPAPEPVASPIDRASVLRDRTRLACQSLTGQLGRPVHSFTDVFRVMIDNFPDSATVEPTEIIQSCLMHGTSVNGGGRFNIDQSGDTILMRFDQHAGGGGDELIGRPPSGLRF